MDVSFGTTASVKHKTMLASGFSQGWCAGCGGLPAGASHALQLGRVVMDTLCFRLDVIFGSTFLSGTIPQAHLLLIGLNSLEVKYLTSTSSITSLKNKNKKINV